MIGDIKKVFLAFMLLAFGSLASAVVSTAAIAGSITVELDRSVVEEGEDLILTLTISGNLQQNLKVPQVKGVRVSNGGRSQQYSNVNGKSTSQQVHTLILSPSGVGSYTFPSIVGKVDGERSATQPLSFKVVAAKGQGNSVAGGAGEPQADVFIRRKVSNTSPMLGETFVLTVELYTRVGFRLSSLDSAEGLPDNFRYIKKQEMRAYEKQIGSSRYTVSATKFIVVPLQAGEMSFPLRRWKVSYLKPGNQQRRRSRSLFDEMFSGGNWVRQQKQIKAPAVPVKVLAIPANKPSGYLGLVGDFKISTRVSARTVKTGDTVTVTIKLAGLGLLEKLLPPKLPLANDVKVYADKPTGQQNFSLEQGVISEKEFKYAVVPTKSGELDLGAVKIPVYNPVKNQFETLAAEFGSVSVGEGDAEKSVIISAGGVKGIGSGSKKKIKKLSDDLIDIHRRFDPQTTHALTEQDFLSLGLLGGIPFALFLLTFGGQGFLHYKNSDQVKLRRTKSYKTFKAALAKAEASETSAAKGGILLIAEYDRAFRVFLGDKFGLNGLALTKQELKTVLSSHKVKDTVIAEASEVFDQVQKLQFSSTATVEALNFSAMLTKIKDVASEVDKQC